MLSRVLLFITLSVFCISIVGQSNYNNDIYNNLSDYLVDISFKTGDVSQTNINGVIFKFDKDVFLLTSKVPIENRHSLNVLSNKFEIDSIVFLGYNLDYNISVYRVNDIVNIQLKKSFSSNFIGQSVFVFGTNSTNKDLLQPGEIIALENTVGNTTDMVSISAVFDMNSQGSIVSNSSSEIIGISKMYNISGRKNYYFVPISRIDNIISMYKDVKYKIQTDDINMPEIKNKQDKSENNKSDKTVTDDDYFLIMNAVAAYEDGLYEAAAGMYKDIINKNEDDAKCHLNLGATYAMLGDYKNAQESFNKALELDTTYYIAYNNIGVSNALDGNYENAIINFFNALKYNRNDYVPYFNMGRVYFDKGEYERCIINMKRAIELNNKCVDCYNMVGLSFYKKNRISDAKYNLSKALSIDEYNSFTLFNLGTINYVIKDYSKAINNLEKAKINKPYDYGIDITIGNCYVELKKYSEAIKSYKYALEKKPNNYEILYYLGIAYALNDDDDNAVVSYKKSIKLFPNYINALYNLGAIYTSQDNYTEAISTMKRIVEINNKHSEAHYSLGILYKIIGEEEKSKLHTNKAIEINPQFKSHQ